MQEEVPDTRGLDPGDVGGRAGEDAGLVLHGAADWPEAHHAVHLPAVPAQLAQQRPARVALKRRRKRRDATSFKRKLTASPPQGVLQSWSSPGRQQVDLLCPGNLRRSWSLARGRPRTSSDGRS